MYIQKAKIENIRSIIDFDIKFPNPAGWHVLIGDNGAGKSTIIRSMALALMGEIQAQGLRPNWDEWLKRSEIIGRINLDLTADKKFDQFKEGNNEAELIESSNQSISFAIDFERKDDGLILINEVYSNSGSASSIEPRMTHSWQGFFSAAYGPYRRFKGGSLEWESVFRSTTYEDLAAHLSIFDESVALTEAVSWLQELNYKHLEKNRESGHTLDNLKKLINSEDFLPHNSTLESVSSEGVYFKDGNNFSISVNQMSDGYRSILSMTFELIRQLVRVYGSEMVFKNIQNGEMFIDLPGVVLIDEIDAHLHPTWQTRIGQWFLKYFPQLQFIVTSHSPLVCRAAEKGSIWRLAAPGSDQESGEVMGIDRERLIHGNILDAYGTEVFGRNVSISKDSNDMLDRLAELNIKSMMGGINTIEKSELENLKAILPTESKL